jgi:uncharacterized DUF497 family protein
VKIDYDPAKRASNLKKHGLDFEDCPQVFAGPIVEGPDERRDYGEPRVVTLGLLNERVVIVVWTPRNGTRRIFSMRKANDGEKARFWQRLR